jgi:hypothetical protein
MDGVTLTLGNESPAALHSLPQPLAAVLAQEVKALCAFDRYEKRALSRRKFAIRALDAARAATDGFPR